jgi:hypothetical protein
LTATGEISLRSADIGGALECSEAALSGLECNGKRGLAFSADRLRAGGVILKEVKSTGEVRLAGARVDGDLNCSGARFWAVEEGKRLDRPALMLDKLDVKGSIFFENVRTRGEVRLNGAKVNGSIFCVGSKFGTAEDAEGEAPRKVLNLDGVRASGGLMLRDRSKFNGVLDLTAAEFGSINDESASWPKKGLLILDRCRYGALVGKSPTDAKSRIDWLGRQDHKRWGVDFWPQPYEQCAKVLREMGHGEDARDILIEKDRRQRAVRLARTPLEIRGWLRLRDRVLWHTVRYGRQPLRAAVWLGVFWAIGTVIFFSASNAGAIKPNKEVVLHNSEWVECREGGDKRGEYISQLACFFEQPQSASFPEFNALIYSADTLLPVVSLEMQNYWIPDESSSRGKWARVYLWVHIAVGWALSLLAVAGFSGLVKSD